MKVYNLFSIVLVVLCTTLGVHSKSKRAETSDECKYINSMLGEDETYDCCNYDGIECENGNIIKM